MSRFRVGVMDMITASRSRAELAARASYLGAAASRADSFWVPDHLNGLFPRSMWEPDYVGATKLIPKPDAYLEPWTMLGYLAARNRIGRLSLGVGVTDAGRRNPAVTAQAAATVQLLSRGRAILGIGTGERVGNEPYGVDWSTPVARLEEALATIRALWDSKGELVNRDSPFFPLRDALFDLPPYRGKWPQLWIAAHGPRMLRTVGRFGDAWFPGLLTRPQDYVKGLDVVRSAASNAGRDPMTITPALWITVVTGRSRESVDAALDAPAMKALALCAPGHSFARHGAQHPLGADFTGMQDHLPYKLDKKTALSHAAEVPSPVMRDVCLNGTPNEVVEQVAQLRDCGLRYIVLLNVSFMQPSLRTSMESNMPFLKIVRTLKKL